MKYKVLLIAFFSFCCNSLFAQIGVTRDTLACGIDSVILHASIIGDIPTSTGITADDGYSGVIPLGFTYTFYGTANTQCVISSNGYLRFNTSYAGSGSGWYIGSALLGNANCYNSVCGPWCDVYIPAGGTITYSTVGTAPTRKFTATWCHCAMYSCTSQWLTTQIILYETSNIAEVHIAHHTTCAWNGGYAIVGVQNSTGTAATVAPGRDYPSVWTAVDEAWRFTPSGTTSFVCTSIPYAPIPYASSAIYWYDSTTGAYLGTGPSLHDTATVPRTYKAAALGCGDTTFAYMHVDNTATSGGGGSGLHITSYSHTDPSHCGFCDGSIKLTGITPHEIDSIFYAFNGVPHAIVVDSSSGADSSITLNGLCAGLYNYFYVKVGHCPSNTVGPITITNPAFFISSTSHTTPSICGASDASITLYGLVPGTSDTIRYTKNTVAQTPIVQVVSSTGTLTMPGLGAGTYSITVTMNNCTTAAVSVTIVDPSFDIGTTSHTTPSVCGAFDASFTLGGLISGTSDTINYRKNGVPQTAVVQVVSSAGTITITGLGAGVYSNIIVTMNNCNTGPVSLTITDPAFGIADTSSTNASCSACDGTITLHGLTPMQTITVNYSFNGVPASPVVTSSNVFGLVVLTNLCPGFYSNITATLNTCVSNSVGIVHISPPPLIPISAASHVNPSECGACNGRITMYGTPPGIVDSIFYNLNGVPQPPIITSSTSDSMITMYNLCQGDYSNFFIKSGPCPTTTISATISVVDPPITPAFTTNIHRGCNDDTVYFSNSSTSTGALWYVWHFGDGSSDTSTNPVHIFHTQGVYNVTLIITNHHCVDSISHSVDLVHPIKAIFGPKDTLVCQGSPIAFYNSSIGTPPTYVWSFGDNATSTAVNPNHTFTNVGTYKVQLIATNLVPCSDTAYTNVTVDSFTVMSLAASDTAICKGTYINFGGTYTGIGNTGVTWDFGNGDSIKDMNPLVYAYMTTGTFTVTSTATYRVCPSVSVSRTITVLPSPNINLGPDTSICEGGESIILDDYLNATNGAAKWLWSTGETGHSITVNTAGYYSATVNINNCFATDSVWVANDCYINMPNIFTPNGDGVNDYFYPRSLLTKGLIEFKMSIYNRWGQIVFETHTIDGRGWDGRLNNQAQPEGVYIYMIDGTFKDGVKEHHQGNITLLR